MVFPIGREENERVAKKAGKLCRLWKVFCNFAIHDTFVEMKHDTSIQRKQMKDRIMDAATRLFHQHGIKSVKMDDIASSLSMSKRTLYEIYGNKEDLLCEVVKMHEEQHHNRLVESTRQKSNVIDIVVEVYRMLILEVKEVNPLFFEELQMYPQLLEYLHSRREEHRKQTMDFMKRGVAEGFFRDDVNYEIIQKMFDMTTLYMMNNFLYKQYPIEELFRCILFSFLRGICTTKGVRRIDLLLESKE